MKIAIGSDHAGFTYKEAIREHLAGQGHTVKDFGTYSPDSCDYPDFIRPVAEAVAAAGEFERGIVLGGSAPVMVRRLSQTRCAGYDAQSAGTFAQQDYRGSTTMQI